VRRRRQQGFSLLEVLAAMTLFAMVAAALGALATTSFLHTVLNRHASTAAMLAQEELEDMRGQPFAALAGGTRSVTVSGQSYSIDSDVAADTPAEGMSHITVTVNWTGPYGDRSYEIETIFTATSAAIL
jgi:prepilin-type N-terminal cleavage/methylation domain-containing protein